MTYLEEHYWTNIRRNLIAHFPYSNNQSVGKLEQIIITHTSRDILKNNDNIIPVLFAFQLITNQKPKKICAKNSVASWQLRKGQIIGCQVTLRKELMYTFLEKLVLYNISNIEKNTISKKINNNNQYQMGIKNFASFFEIENQLDIFRQTIPNWNLFGCHIQFITSCNSKDETSSLLRGLCLPI